MQKGGAEMSGGAAVMRDINYVKPNITNLRGRRGRAVIEEIKNAKPDYESEAESRRRAEECIDRVLAKRNGERK